MQQSIEEFEAQLAAITNLAEKTERLSQFIRYYVEVDPKKSLELSQRAHSLAQNQPALTKGIYDSLTNLAICHTRLGNLEQAMAYAMQAHTLANSNNNIEQSPLLLNILGNLFQDLGEYKESLNYYLKALDLVEKQKNFSQQESLLINIGTLYHALNDYEQELVQYKKVLDLQKQRDSDRRTATLLNNMAMAYKAMNELDTAVTKAKQSLALARKHKAAMLEANALCTLGEIYLDMQDFEQALWHLTKSTQLAHTLQVRFIEGYGLRKIGELLQQKNQPEDAVIYLQKSLALAEKSQNLPEQSACLRALAKVQKGIGNFQQAYRYFEQFHEIDKKLYKEQADRTVRQLQIIHQTQTIQQEAELYKQKTEELDAYARTVAHDLKQPNSVILLYAELLPKMLPPELQNDRLLKAITTIDRSAKQAEQTIRSLLLLATVNKTAVPVEPLNMATAVNHALNRLQPMIQQCQAAIHLPEKWETAIGYQPWLEEVWLNYLSNALKYGGKVPQLTLGCSNDTTNMVRFWIQNYGPTIPAEFRANLFQEFSQLPKTDIPNDSHGLGLAIVKRIIEKLGGEVGYEAGTERGSLFYFTLPCQTTNS